MLKPRQDLRPNTADYETTPLVKPTGFREYDARWVLEKEINLLGIQALGLGLATYVHEIGQRPGLAFRGREAVDVDDRPWRAAEAVGPGDALLAAGPQAGNPGLPLGQPGVEGVQQRQRHDTSSMARAISLRQRGEEKRWSASLTIVRRMSGPVA